MPNIQRRCSVARGLFARALARGYLTHRSWHFARARGEHEPLAQCLLYSKEMQAVVKGMVQVHSITYRIVRVRAGHYDVVRLLDDVRVGSFSLGSRREALVAGDATEVIREVARAALQGGRTTWAPRRLSA